MEKSINIGGELLSLGSPAVMSIINVTDDSFYGASRSIGEKDIAEAVERAIEEGADILDTGGYSSRPGASDIPVEEETRRVLMAVSALRNFAGYFPFSVDTFRSEVVERVFDEYGAFMVNDITAGGGDENMIPLVGKLGLPYIAMHMRGTPQTMSELTSYDDIVGDILAYFRDKIEELKSAGVKDIILDPGFGFAKTLEQNIELMRRLSEFSVLPHPLLVGISRKSMIYKSLDTTADDSLVGTALLNWEALRAGASILRVHDTHQCRQTITLREKYYGGSTKL